MGLPQPLVPWTHTGNYPAGANLWNSQPLALAPAGTYFTPNTKPAAEELNYLFGTRDVQTLLVTAAVAGIANDWQQEFPSSTNFNPGPFNLTVDWDPFNGLWLMGGSSSPGGTPVTTLYYTRGMDADQRWLQIGGTNITSGGSGYSTGMAASIDPTAHAGGPAAGNYFAALVQDDGTNNGIISIYKCTAGTWGAPSTIGMYSPLLTEIQTVHFAFIGTQIVLGIGNTATHTGTSANALFYLSGGTWHAVATGSLLVSEILFTSNGTILVAALAGTISGDSAYLYSTDGISWTRVAFPVAVTASCTGICYTQDNSGPVFLAQFYDSTTTSTYYLKSANAVTWFASGAPVTFYQGVDLAACGSLVFASLADNGSGGGAGMVFSPDGGQTWYGTSNILNANAANTNAFYLHPRVKSNGLRACFYNNLWSRFSLQCGLPILPL